MSLSSRGKDICALDRRELAALFEEATAFETESIAGYRYRGVSLGLPRWIEKLSWKKFAKTFYRDEDGLIRGFNTRIEQSSLDAPWQARDKRGQEWRFGPFQVMDAVGEHDVELDYGMTHRGLSPLRCLRDPLRALDEEGGLLLGRSLLDIGLARRVGTPAWFLLERDQPYSRQ